MAKFAYAERVCKKVRKMLSRDNRFIDIVKGQPSVDLDENFNMRGLHWSYYDRDIYVTTSLVAYYERSRLNSVLMTYNGFEELLKL